MASSSSGRGTIRQFAESEELDGPSSKRPRLEYNSESELGAEILQESADPPAGTSNSGVDAYKAENSTELDSQMTHILSSSKTYNHDEKYYFDDGSCVLLVDNTLFNVHRSILSRDNSFFSTMFTLPQADQTELDGSSDSNPITLYGDSSDEFRYFLWALYALPPELEVVHTPSADLSLLIGIARVSNKYGFKTILNWSLNAIQEYVNRKPSTLGISTTYTYSVSAGTSTTTGGGVNAAQLTALIRLAQLCSHEPLLSSMIALLRGLMSSSLQYAYLAMSLADELDLNVLRGAAYAEVLNRGIVVRDVSVLRGKQKQVEISQEDLQEGDIDDSGRLLVTPAQQMRLLTGYYRLSRAFEDIRNHPPVFEHTATCAATWQLNGCTQSWTEFWKEKIKSDAVLNLGNADVLGKLRCVMKEFERWGSATYMHSSCRTVAARKIQHKIKEIEETLGDFFTE